MGDNSIFLAISPPGLDVVLIGGYLAFWGRSVTENPDDFSQSRHLDSARFLVSRIQDVSFIGQKNVDDNQGVEHVKGRYIVTKHGVINSSYNKMFNDSMLYIIFPMYNEESSYIGDNYFFFYINRDLWQP